MARLSIFTNMDIFTVYFVLHPQYFTQYISVAGMQSCFQAKQVYFSCPAHQWCFFRGELYYWKTLSRFAWCRFLRSENICSKLTGFVTKLRLCWVSNGRGDLHTGNLRIMGMHAESVKGMSVGHTGVRRYMLAVAAGCEGWWGPEHWTISRRNETQVQCKEPHPLVRVEAWK